MEEPLSSTEVGIFVGLRLRRESSVGSPQIDQGLHGLELMWSEHIKRCCGQDEVTEAAIELLLQIQMVERLSEVGPVKVGIDSEHLTEDGLADLDEVLWETRSFAHPIRLSRVG